MAPGIISQARENVLQPPSAMQRRRDRRTSCLMTSVLAVALAVSTFGAPLPTMTGTAHACCTRMAGPCPPTSLQCCTFGQRDRTPEPLPTPRAKTPAPDLDQPLPFLAARLTPLPTSPVVCLKHLVAPPALYLLNSTLLV
jgi:hypothetical protein